MELIGGLQKVNALRSSGNTLSAIPYRRCEFSLAEHFGSQLDSSNEMEKFGQKVTSLRALLQQMFSLFWDQPLYNTYYAYDPFTFRRTPSRRTRYLNYLENRLASLINDEFDDFWDSPPQKKQTDHDQSPPQSPATPSGEGQSQPQPQPQPPAETKQSGENPNPNPNPEKK
jgi:hypothetical protein